jgi:hypothetical protein
LRGLDLAEPGAERVGLAVVSFSLLGRAGRELGIKHGGAVVAEQVLVGEQGERGGDDLVFDGDPAVLGVGAGVAGRVLPYMRRWHWWQRIRERSG